MKAEDLLAKADIMKDIALQIVGDDGDTDDKNEG